ncbi:MAG: bifunctional folylpolyglutamate synthase/dihydrofolate synthase [Actinobacteria bacterium]|nr:bifunctional folylpolyglutamate synthase/dihydrofolate synthase [Actinomycetota bacterium]
MKAAAAPVAPPKPSRPKPPPEPQFDVQGYLADLDRLGMKLGLARINKLLDALGNPQKKIKTIHVVGTNGKSSTARMIAAILASQGLKAGAYLSPHLVTFTERMLINGKEIPEPRFNKLIVDVRNKAEEVNKRSRSSGPLTQFEILTAAAFLYFHQQKVDCAVIEAGLGGRYDATNVIDSKVQVLTNIELEHTDLLGKTISAILKEKTAVIPEKGNVVLGALSPEALKEARKICLAKNAKVQIYDDDFSLLRGSGEKFDVMTGKHSYEDLQMALVGHYQRTNCTVAIQAAELFLRKELDEKKMKRALPRITIPGRLEIIDEKPLVILDGAHNPSGIAELIESLQPLVAGKRIIGVVSILKDKDASGMLGQLLEFCDILFVTENSNPRCMTAQELSRLPVVEESHVQTFVARESQSALESAFKLASMRDVILVTGSLYLLSDIKKRMA